MCTEALLLVGHSLVVPVLSIRISFSQISLLASFLTSLLIFIHFNFSKFSPIVVAFLTLILQRGYFI